MIHVMLFPVMTVLHFAINTFRSMCAVTNMAVVVYCLDIMPTRYVAQVFSE